MKRRHRCRCVSAVFCYNVDDADDAAHRRPPTPDDARHHSIAAMSQELQDAATTPPRHDAQREKSAARVSRRATCLRARRRVVDAASARGVRERDMSACCAEKDYMLMR